MNKWKVILLCAFANVIVFAILSCSNRILSPVKSTQTSDTLSGYFLYECNVPYKAFSRLDQVENSNNIIFLGNINNQQAIEILYKKGIFSFSYSPEIVKYITEKNIGLNQNKASIQKFDSSINYIKYLYDTAYNKTLIYDSKKILSYKRVYLKFVYKTLGRGEMLIPDIVKYQCCYSNKKVATNSYFITEILEFRIL